MRTVRIEKDDKCYTVNKNRSNSVYRAIGDEKQSQGKRIKRSQSVSSDIKLDKFGSIKSKFNELGKTVYKHSKSISSMGMTSNGKQNNKTKTNQDCYFILNNIFNTDYNIYCMLDGHGKKNLKKVPVVILLQIL